MAHEKPPLVPLSREPESCKGEDTKNPEKWNQACLDEMDSEACRLRDYFKAEVAKDRIVAQNEKHRRELKLQREEENIRRVLDAYEGKEDSSEIREKVVESILHQDEVSEKLKEYFRDYFLLGVPVTDRLSVKDMEKKENRPPWWSVLFVFLLSGIVVFVIYWLHKMLTEIVSPVPVL